MPIAIIGQQDFGKAVLEAMLGRGDTVPAPGAWTTYGDSKLFVYDARRHVARSFSQVRSKLGTVTAIDGQSVYVASQGGQIELIRARRDAGKKLSAAQVCAEAGITVGSVLGG